MRRLSSYDIESGTRIDTVFASFEGLDPNREMARVFAAVVHRRTGGVPDGTNNPLGVRGAGWIGVVGVADGSVAARAGVAMFASIADGSIAAALLFHGRGFSSVRSAYRAGDAVRLARAIETSALRASIDLLGLELEVAGVREKRWSLLADSVRFRHIPRRATSKGIGGRVA